MGERGSTVTNDAQGPIDPGSPAPGDPQGGQPVLPLPHESLHPPQGGLHQELPGPPSNVVQYPGSYQPPDPPAEGNVPWPAPDPASIATPQADANVAAAVAPVPGFAHAEPPPTPQSLRFYPPVISGTRMALAGVLGGCGCLFIMVLVVIMILATVGTSVANSGGSSGGSSGGVTTERFTRAGGFSGSGIPADGTFQLSRIVQVEP